MAQGFESASQDLINKATLLASTGSSASLSLQTSGIDGRDYIEISSNASGSFDTGACIHFSDIDGVTNDALTDCEVYMEFVVNGDSAQFLACGMGDTTTFNAVGGWWRERANERRIYRFSEDDSGEIAAETANGFQTGVLFAARVRREGSLYRYRSWRLGDPEPSEFQLEVVQAGTYPSVQVIEVKPEHDHEVYAIGIGTNGDVAPRSEDEIGSIAYGISGTVSNQSDFEGIEGATVIVRDDGSEIAETFTDSDGSYSTEVLFTDNDLPRTLTVEAGAGGFEEDAEDVTIDTDETQYVVDFQLEETPVPNYLDLRLSHNPVVALQEVDGGEWKDHSGNNNHAELIGGPTVLSEGDLPGAQLVNGVRTNGSDNYLAIPYDSSLNDPTEELTLEYIFRPLSDPDERWTPHVAQGDTTYQVRRESDDSVFDTVRFSFRNSDTGMTEDLSYEESGVFNEWRHVAVTFNSNQGRARVYIDGSLVASRTGSFDPLGEDPTSRLTMGVQDNSGTLRRWIEMEAGALTVYPFELTAAQVQELDNTWRVEPGGGGAEEVDVTTTQAAQIASADTLVYRTLDAATLQALQTVSASVTGIFDASASTRQQQQRAEAAADVVATITLEAVTRQAQQGTAASVLLRAKIDALTRQQPQLAHIAAEIVGIISAAAETQQQIQRATADLQSTIRVSVGTQQQPQTAAATALVATILQTVTRQLPQRTTAAFGDLVRARIQATSIRRAIDLQTSTRRAIDLQTSTRRAIDLQTSITRP